MDHQQITFVTINRFWPLALADDIKLDGIQTKLKWKAHILLTLYFKFWRLLSLKSFRIQWLLLFFLLFYISFFISRYHFHNFWNFTWKTIFVRNFSFLTDLFRSPSPLTGKLWWEWQRFFWISPSFPNLVIWCQSLT